MTPTLAQLYRSREAYRLPVYSVRQAARLTGLNSATVRAWCRPGDAELVQRASPTGLSFLNLVELHVLAAIRRQHQLPMGRVRHAVHYVRHAIKTAHPLAEQLFETDGVDLFIRALDDTLVNASRQGQVVILIRELMGAYLKRIERAPDGFPLRLYPVYQHGLDTGWAVEQAPSVIAVDPAVAFGRPFLVQGQVPVDVIVGRYQAGESVGELADDYGLPAGIIEEAIRYELENVF